MAVSSNVPSMAGAMPPLADAETIGMLRVRKDQLITEMPLATT